MEKTRVPRENHNIQCIKDTLYHIRLYRVHFTKGWNQTDNISPADGHFIYYSETCLNQTLSKQKTCLNQTDFTVLYTEP